MDVQQRNNSYLNDWVLKPLSTAGSLSYYVITDPINTIAFLSPTNILKTCIITPIVKIPTFTYQLIRHPFTTLTDLFHAIVTITAPIASFVKDRIIIPLATITYSFLTQPFNSISFLFFRIDMSPFITEKEEEFFTPPTSPSDSFIVIHRSSPDQTASSSSNKEIEDILGIPSYSELDITEEQKNTLGIFTNLLGGGLYNTNLFYYLGWSLASTLKNLVTDYQNFAFDASAFENTSLAKEKEKLENLNCFKALEFGLTALSDDLQAFYGNDDASRSWAWIVLFGNQYYNAKIEYKDLVAPFERKSPCELIYYIVFGLAPKLKINPLELMNILRLDAEKPWKTFIEALFAWKFDHKDLGTFSNEHLEDFVEKLANTARKEKENHDKIVADCLSSPNFYEKGKLLHGLSEEDEEARRLISREYYIQNASNLLQSALIALS